MLEERRQRWMQDLRNRQRNIVFPDTVLNEARGFRSIFSGKTKLTLLHRLCMVPLGLSFLFGTAFVIRFGIDVFRSLEGWGLVIGIIVTLGISCIWLPLSYLGLRLFMEGVMPSSAGPVVEVARPPAVPGVIRRPFSQRPRRRMQRGKSGEQNLTTDEH